MPLLKNGIAPAVIAPAAPVITAPVETKAAAPKAKYSDDDKMSKAEWAAKDKRISRAGAWQAAIQSTGLMQYPTEPTLEAYLAVVRKAAEDGLAFINEASK